jgi:osmotically-inducible protein OsmY
MTAAPPSDPYLTERIRTAIAQDARVNELGITVALVGERVFVTGTVLTAERREGIAAVIAEQFPTLELHNDVTVQEIGSHPTPETLE